MPLPVIYPSFWPPSPAAALNLNALLGQLGRWPALGTGAAQSFQATGSPSNGTTHDAPVWVPGDFPKGAPDVCDLTGQVAGCIDFGTGGAKGVTVGGTGWDMAGLNALGLGKLQLGPAHSIVLFHKFDSAAFPGSAYGGLALAAGGNAWFIHKVSTDFRLDWFQGLDRQRSAGSDLTGDNHWHMYHLRFRGDAALDMGVDGVPTFGPTIIAGVTGFNLLSLGALTGTPYGVGRMCLARYFNRRVSDTELQTMAAGGQPDFPPDVVYLLDQTSGTNVPDSAQVWTPGSAVSPIPDTTGHANNMAQATAGNRGIYTVSSPVPQEFIPLYGGADPTNAGGLEGSVRLDGSNDAYSAANVVGAGVETLSGVFLGRMEDPVRASGAYDHLMAILNLSGSGTHTLKLGMRSGGPPAAAFQPGRTWKWVLETFDGTNLRQVKEDLAGVEPVVLGFRYQGGATAGARLLELWRGDASGMTKRDELTGAAVPQFLNLDAVPALGSGGDNNAGWQHADGTLSNQCWSPAYLQSVMAKMAATTVLPNIYRLNLFGTGFDGNHVDGFSQGSCPIRDGSGRLHVLHNPGLSDPSHWPEYYTYLDPDGSGGYTLVSSTKIRDTASVSYFTFGSAALQFAGGARAGELMALGSYGPDTGAYAVGNTGPSLWRCTNPAGSPPTWSYTDLASQIPAGIDYFWPCGKIFELTPGGTLITTFYGIKTGDGSSLYSTWLMQSVDQGSTWTVLLHIPTATGNVGTPMFEPCLIQLASGWALEMRSGATTLVTFSPDLATWTPVVRMGANGTMPTQVQPGSYRCQDGTILRFIGVRDTGTPSFDPGMRFGTLVARYDSTFRVCKRGPTPVDLALDGRCYHSTFYAGMKAGKHRVGLITSDDRVNLVLIISDEDYWQ